MVVTSRSTSHSTILRGSCLFVILFYFYMSPSQRSVCDCNKTILHCIVLSASGTDRRRALQSSAVPLLNAHQLTLIIASLALHGATSGTP